MSAAVPMIEIPQQRLRGVGSISAQRAEKKISLPLSEVKISAKVAERISTVNLTQVFENPYTDHLEAVYIFPLPGGAAVSDFEMKIGSRVVKGRVEERSEARRQYQQAIEDGKRAALMEKERDDVFTVQVGNIPPNEKISICISYSEPLAFFEEGTTELRLPLVVSPRYTPGQPQMRDQVGDGVEFDTDIVPDASRISPPRLVKGFDPKIGLSIDVIILWDESEGSGEIKDLCCSQHATKTSAGREGIKISLARNDELLNRDFVLRWTVSGETLHSSLLVYGDPNSKDEKDMSYGMLSLLPPKNQKLDQARDVVFILDRSGSMQGIKMASAARACALLLTTLGPRDRFAIQCYSYGAEWYQPPSFSYGVDGYFMPADYWGLEQGEKYLRSIEADGGTETGLAISCAIDALEKRKEKEDRTPVIVLLTDGEVADESRIFKEVQERLGLSRLFTIGIDSAINQGFLQRLANIGRATSTFVTPGAELENALVSVGREIGSPLVVDLKVYDVDSNLQLSSVAPFRMTDLFTGRASTTFFMLGKSGKVRVTGKYANGEKFETIVEAKESSIPAIAQLWAKTRITDLEDWYRIDPNSQEQIKQQIISLSIKHKILTRFTAFVAVDHEEKVNQEGYTRKVVQPVEMPADWQMEAQVSASTPMLQNIPAPAKMKKLDDGVAPIKSEPLPSSIGGVSEVEGGYFGGIRGSNASSPRPASPMAPSSQSFPATSRSSSKSPSKASAAVASERAMKESIAPQSKSIPMDKVSSSGGGLLKSQSSRWMFILGSLLVLALIILILFLAFRN